MEKINHLTVFYGDGEYTSHVSNLDLAKRYAKPELFPLLVMTYEHGGWHMTYYFDAQHTNGVCVGTANDRARFDDATNALRERIFNAERNTLPDIRRPALPRRAS